MSQFRYENQWAIAAVSKDKTTSIFLDASPDVWEQEVTMNSPFCDDASQGLQPPSEPGVWRWDGTVFVDDGNNGSFERTDHDVVEEGNWRRIYEVTP